MTGIKSPVFALASVPLQAWRPDVDAAADEQQIERAVQEGFIRPEHQALLLVDTNADALLEKMLAYRSPGLPKWIDREDA